jgi:hypothetical protein
MTKKYMMLGNTSINVTLMDSLFKRYLTITDPVLYLRSEEDDLASASGKLTSLFLDSSLSASAMVDFPSV